MEHLAASVADPDGYYRHRTSKGFAQLRAEVSLYERAMDRCQRFLSDWLRLGFDERRVALEEAQAARATEVVVRALVRLGLGERESQARLAVAEELEALDAGGRRAASHVG